MVMVSRNEHGRSLMDSVWSSSRFDLVLSHLQLFTTKIRVPVEIYVILWCLLSLVQNQTQNHHQMGSCLRKTHNEALLTAITLYLSNAAAVLP
jgi:hypothetical protein